MDSEVDLPILPIIDLLVLLGSLSLGVGFVLKVTTITTRYNPTPLGFSSLDFVLIAAIFFVFALTLTARTWMKLNEPRLFAARREAAAVQARLLAAEHDLAVAKSLETSPQVAAEVVEAASADRR